jgi:hypothetical protein
MNRIRVVIAVTLVAAPLAAQAPAAPLTPAGWDWRTDAPASPRRGTDPATAGTFEFSRMAPGWHVTMGPGGVLYDPSQRAEGRFVVEGEMILFPDASEEEYGVLVGGGDLGGAAATWIAFVVRADGSAAVMQYAGGAASMVLPWTRSAGVKVRATGATAKNFVTVRAEPDSVRFLVNGERIGAWARTAMPVDGSIGFRIGRGVNLHITNLDLTRRLAPFPVR